MLAGAGIVDPDTTFVEADVVLAPDCVIHPFTVLRGADVASAPASAGRPARRAAGRARRRGLPRRARSATCAPGVLARRARRSGRYVEVKGSVIGERAKVPHLSYIGDADIGADTNIGAGAITANYDGRRKHRTVIGAGVRTWRTQCLRGAGDHRRRRRTAAGSLITEDVPSGALGIARAATRSTSTGLREAQQRRDDG